LERAHSAARSLEGVLRLGLFSGLVGGPRLVEIVDAFSAQHPECQVEIVQVSWDDPLAPIRDGDVQLMACWLPLEQPDLVVGPVLTRQPRVAAATRDHPLAGRDSVSLEELAEYPIPHFDGWPRELHEAFFPSTAPSGRSIPTVRIPVGERNLLELTHRVGRREFVFPTVISADPVMGLGQYDLAYVPITGMTPARSALIWRRGDRDLKRRAFIGIARDVLKAAKRTG
jgi:DNA-binding transcriptional LysR family regulator